MSLKIITVLYLFLAFEATIVVSLTGKDIDLTDLDQKGILRDQKISELDSLLNQPNNMCQLCTKEMADETMWKQRGMETSFRKYCYSLGDYHDFHVDKWAVSIYIPQNASVNICYFDLFPPQEPGNKQKEFIQKEQERFYLTNGCEKGCITKNNNFKIQQQQDFKKQHFPYQYEIMGQNKSGEYILK